jgi:hypothetical protein
VESLIRKQSNENSEDDLDERLYKKIIKDNNTAQQIEDFSEAMRLACEQSFKTNKALNKRNTNQFPGGLRNSQ